MHIRKRGLQHLWLIMGVIDVVYEGWPCLVSFNLVVIPQWFHTILVWINRPRKLGDLIYFSELDKPAYFCHVNISSSLQRAISQGSSPLLLTPILLHHCFFWTRVSVLLSWSYMRLYFFFPVSQTETHTLSHFSLDVSQFLIQTWYKFEHDRSLARRTLAFSCKNSNILHLYGPFVHNCYQIVR